MSHERDDTLTGAVIGAFYAAYNALGYGFLESVYANALAIELRKRGIRFVREARITIRYEAEVIGTFRADFLVEERIVAELKATRVLVEADRAQLLNCLRASELRIGLLLHFGPEPEVRRVVAPRRDPADGTAPREHGKH